MDCGWTREPWHLHDDNTQFDWQVALHRAIYQSEAINKLITDKLEKKKRKHQCNWNEKNGMVVEGMHMATFYSWVYAAISVRSAEQKRNTRSFSNPARHSILSSCDSMLMHRDAHSLQQEIKRVLSPHINIHINICSSDNNVTFCSICC